MKVEFSSSNDISSFIFKKISEGKSKVATANTLGINLLTNDTLFRNIAYVYNIDTKNQTLKEARVEFFEKLSINGWFYRSAINVFYNPVNGMTNNSLMALEVLEGFDTLLTFAETKLGRKYESKIEFHRGWIWFYRTIFYLSIGRSEQATISMIKARDSDLETFKKHGKGGQKLREIFINNHYERLLPNNWFNKSDIESFEEQLLLTREYYLDKLLIYSIGSFPTNPKVTYTTYEENKKVDLELSRDLSIINDNQ